MTKSSRLVLIDGNAVLHRAYHALPPLTTKSGQLVNAVYGFASMLVRVVKELHPGYLIVCFDRPKPTFRQAIYVGYQHKRPKMDDDLAGQIEMVHSLVSHMNIPIYEKDGFEADDILGTLAKQFVSGKDKTKNPPSPRLRRASKEAIIVTGDRDLLQLVSNNTKIYMMTKGISEAALFNAKDVEKKYGIKPSQIIDYKALIGDSSDNYAGVPGIGPKTAVDLIEKFGDLDNVYAKLHKIDREKVVNLLKEGKDSAYLAKQLATIVTKVPVKIDLDKAKLPNLATKEALDFLGGLGFQSLVKRLTGKDQEEIKKEKKSKINDNQLGLF